jgi:hypothetical protein
MLFEKQDFARAPPVVFGLLIFMVDCLTSAAA